MDVITFPGNLLTPSGLLILLHNVISLSDATSHDKTEIKTDNNYIYANPYKSNINLHSVTFVYSLQSRIFTFKSLLPNQLNQIQVGVV